MRSDLHDNTAIQGLSKILCTSKNCIFNYVSTSATIEQQQRITRVIDYIFSHPEQDLSRRALSVVAHYSPEHLPKLFKQHTGETPKQYSLRLRLETAFHFLVIHPRRPVSDIALDCGFNTLSVFSRAIKTHFGHSPEQIRRLPHATQMRLLHRPSPTFSSPITGNKAPHPEIRVSHQPALNGCYVLAPFNEPEKITQAFQALRELAGDCAHLPYMGILTPHLHNTYRACLPASQHGELPTTRIAGGLYASFTVTGDLRTTNKAAHYFYRRWLPTSGYRIAGIAGFETFDENPATTDYYKLHRHIHIPIERIAAL